jgi:hypothetical protein
MFGSSFQPTKIAKVSLGARPVSTPLSHKPQQSALIILNTPYCLFNIVLLPFSDVQDRKMEIPAPAKVCPVSRSPMLCIHPPTRPAHTQRVDISALKPGDDSMLDQLGAEDLRAFARRQARHIEDLEGRARQQQDRLKDMQEFMDSVVYKVSLLMHVRLLRPAPLAHCISYSRR